MIFFGASGHSKVVIETWLASGGKVSGVFDDNPEIKEVLGYPVSSRYQPEDFKGKELCISIGSNRARKKIAEILPATFKAVVHPTATISPSAKLGHGSVVMAGVVVNSSARIGRHVILNTASVTEHDCYVGDFAHVSPGSILCGGVFIDEGTHIGAGATVIQNKKIGKWVVIGAGSVITEDVPDFAVVVGVPGRIIKFNKI